MTQMLVNDSIHGASGICLCTYVYMYIVCLVLHYNTNPNDRSAIMWSTGSHPFSLNALQFCWFTSTCIRFQKWPQYRFAPDLWYTQGVYIYVHYHITSDYSLLVYLFICLFVYLSICPYVCIYIYIHMYLIICLSA